jgi:hypothetical protein
MINKKLNKTLVKMMKLSVEVMKCSKENCSKEKNKIMANKKAVTLFNIYNFEENAEKKLKIANHYTKNNIIYEYTKCIIKYSKKMINDILNLIKSIISVIPKNNPKLIYLDNLIIEVKILLKKDELTKKEFKKYIENITELMNTIKSA